MPRTYKDSALPTAGAPADSLDEHWHSTPLVWALIGSSERRSGNPNPDWVQAVRIVLDAGADASQINLDPADPHYPSPAVVDVLRAYGIAPAVKEEE